MFKKILFIKLITLFSIVPIISFSSYQQTELDNYARLQYEILEIQKKILLILQGLNLVNNIPNMPKVQKEKTQQPISNQEDQQKEKPAQDSPTHKLHTSPWGVVPAEA